MRASRGKSSPTAHKLVERKKGRALVLRGKTRAKCKTVSRICDGQERTHHSAV
jgi:hypothetical protein